MLHFFFAFISYFSKFEATYSSLSRLYFVPSSCYSPWTDDGREV